MKKKLIAIFLCVALVAVGIVGASLAYFTDTDEATNTFTTANVDIQLIEQQRNADGSELEAFEQNKVLYPLVGSAQTDAKDKFGLTTAKNYVDKIVTVKNLAADAYVRVYVAVPTKLQAPAAANNVLHWNLGNKFVAAGNKTDGQAINPDYTANMGEWTEIGKTTIEGVQYDVGYITYKKMLTKDEVTGSAFFVGMYLDKGVDYVPATETGEAYYTINGTKIEFDFTKGVKIPVFAVGAQAAGFADETDASGNVTKCAADVAIDAAFGANYSPWTLDPVT